MVEVEVWTKWLQRISRPADNCERIAVKLRWEFLHVSSNFVAVGYKRISCHKSSSSSRYCQQLRISRKSDH